MASTLQRRRFGRVVRLEVEPDMTPEVLDLIVRELEVAEEAVATLPGPLDLRGLTTLVDLPRPELRYATFLPTTQPLLSPEVGEHVDLFALLRDRDVLVHHPYDSFETSTQAFIHQAAHDPRVLAIKQTLYRTSGPGSPVVRALIDAAENGKQVVALVELKARFDEEANIEWVAPSRRPGSTSPTGWSASRRTPRSPWWSATSTTASAATHTSVRATTTTARPASTRTSDCSPPTTTWATT
ncbi:MAG: hypothetical protein WD575_00530 [Nitriliruptoraceae bacterium]